MTGTGTRRRSVSRTLVLVLPLLAATTVGATPTMAADHQLRGVWIRSELNNRCLDAGSGANGANAEVWDCWNGAKQRWYWDGKHIRSDRDNKCLDAGSGINGSPAEVWDCWDGAKQRWYWDGAHLRSELNNRCLDAGGDANGTPAEVWDCWNGAKQRWYEQHPLFR
ncbi:Ricin-type beta-trefoil lectin domain-containing protein [Streptoalloteichus hindustanus]|uniref:Ricin-type beta-trefoil lectin domain-containing protein n=1 Tax=Streptoalloteichus hindustanus TaxID=2017 RepID=A0A1M5I269_STRHI|nr:Ricin-type beta-trefoil lectin domain-containing protein [Streptoalloteichus hindustanus]